MIRAYDKMKKDLEKAYELGSQWRVEHDGFEGSVIGHYITHEGKLGVVLQQRSTQVVHVYGTKWLRSVP